MNSFTTPPTAKADADDLSQHDPLLRLVRGKRRLWYGLGAVALVGIGLAVGVSIPPSPGTPTVEQATVTWINEGLPPPAGSGGPAGFLARVSGESKAQFFQLPDTAIWSNPQNGGWQEPGTTQTFPPCLVPRVHGQPAPDGSGHLRATITFGYVRVPLPDGGPANIVVWVSCQ